jgi:hypothetical protein
MVSPGAASRPVPSPPYSDFARRRFGYRAKLVEPAMRPMPTPSTDTHASLYAEIDRHARRRLIGVWLCFAAATLLSIGMFNALSMMHGDHDFTAVDARIVAVARDPQSGELRMTSEFSDAAGVVHRDTQTDGYHYAPGDPQVGQRIEYLYEAGPITGDFHAFPRADRILQWVFGVPAALLALLGAVVAALVQRERRRRRRLVRNGRREPGQAPSIRRRTVVLPMGNRAEAVAMWRLEASWFDATRSRFVACHGDWEAGTPPELAGAPPPVILVDPDAPSRYWLPSAHGGAAP